jgi:hypothetical protein
MHGPKRIVYLLAVENGDIEELFSDQSAND